MNPLITLLYLDTVVLLETRITHFHSEFLKVSAKHQKIFLLSNPNHYETVHLREKIVFNTPLKALMEDK